MANTTWLIDAENKDLVFDSNGILCTVEDDIASVQCVRMTLEAWKGDFPLVPEHGADYERILGEKEDDDTADEVIREAVFQEERVSALEEIIITMGAERELEIGFTGQLNNGEIICMEVSVNG